MVADAHDAQSFGLSWPRPVLAMAADAHDARSSSLSWPRSVLPRAADARDAHALDPSWRRPVPAGAATGSVLEGAADAHDAHYLGLSLTRSVLAAAAGAHGESSCNSIRTRLSSPIMQPHVDLIGALQNEGSGCIMQDMAWCAESLTTSCTCRFSSSKTRIRPTLDQRPRAKYINIYRIYIYIYIYT